MQRQAEQLAAARQAFQEGKWKAALSTLQAILHEDPACQEAADLQAEVELRYRLDKKRHVRARAIVVPWRRIALFVGILTFLGAALVGSVWLYQTQIQPGMQAAQVRRHRQALFSQAQNNYIAGDFSLSQENLEALLREVPDHADALALQERIAADLALQHKYEQAVALHDGGELGAALELLVELTVESPGYRDVTLRIVAIRKQVQRDSLFADAEDALQRAEFTRALDLYEQVQYLDASYEPEMMRGRIYQTHVAIANEIISREPPDPARLPDAQRHYQQALVLRPRDAVATAGKEIVDTYLDGQSRYYEGRWFDAVRLLKRVYELRPTFFRASVLSMLYDSYVTLGDGYRDGGDVGMAYVSFLDASQLPIDDTALAQKRIVDIKPLLTPTLTPSPTATPTMTFTPLPPPKPTAIPTPRPLSAYHNMIVFTSAHEDYPGYWVMAPDGSNRTFLGQSSTLAQRVRGAQGAAGVLARWQMEAARPEREPCGADLCTGPAHVPVPQPQAETADLGGWAVL